MNCDLCPMSSGLDQKDIARPAQGVKNPDLLVVSRTPMGPQLQQEMIGYLNEAGVEFEGVSFTAVNRCRNFDYNPKKADQKICATEYLMPEIEKLNPSWILTLGNEGLTALTGKAQVTKYRAQVFDVGDRKVFPTLSPSAIKRNPGQREGYISDLRYLSRLMSGNEVDSSLKPDSFKVTVNEADLKELAKDLSSCGGMAFDLETNGFDEFKPDSKIVSLGITTWDTESTRPQRVWAVPLCHQNSPFKDKWKAVVRALGKYMGKPKKRVAHNGKFDLRWLKQFGADFDLTFDTMLAAHLLNENRPKGLKPLARSLLGVAPWDVDTKDLLNEPLKPTLKYNGLDTWYTAHLYFLFLKQLEEQPPIYKLMGLLMVPASNVFTEIEMRGIWVNRKRLWENADIAEQTLLEIDGRIKEYVPRDIAEKDINFNPSNFARWLLFDHLDLPVLERGKAKPDGSPGNPSMAEHVMEKLKRYHYHEVIDLMLQRVKWQKYHSAFFSAYKEQLDKNDRIHTTFKLHGTTTGRLSSGKGDEEKVSGKVQNRGVNLQQVPRDPFVKGIFGGGPGKVFLECDYSQIELRVAAYIARERTMIQLYQNEQDIHTATAMKMTGKPASRVTGEERKKAKPVNFGFLYGMSAATFVQTAWNNYGVEVTEEESLEFRKAFFSQFPDLLTWHSRQRKLAAKYKRVQSPIGRVRHLPDIDSADRAVKASAERQAINSPVQSFASDLAILALVTLTKEFRARGMGARSVGTVHDAINFEVPIKELPVAAPLIKYHMENVPLRKWFGVGVDIPIVGDVSLSQESWGEKEDIDPHVVDSPALFQKWLSGRGLG